MHTHANEIAAIEAAVQQGSQRLNAYAGIHKALRAFMADTLLRLGRTDPHDAPMVQATLAQMLDLLELCERHVQHENDFIHLAIEARCPGVTAPVGDDHVHHLGQIAALRSSVATVASVPPTERAGSLYALYLALGLFVSENFEHMHREETVHNAALWGAYTDEELAKIHDALVASIPPQEMLTIARWLLPYMNAPERLAMMQDMQGGAPEAFVDAVLDVARAHLPDGEWAKLARGLGRAAVPGLLAA